MPLVARQCGQCDLLATVIDCLYDQVYLQYIDSRGPQPAREHAPIRLLKHHACARLANILQNRLHHLEVAKAEHGHAQSDESPMADTARHVLSIHLANEILVRHTQPRIQYTIGDRLASLGCVKIVLVNHNLCRLMNIVWAENSKLNTVMSEFVIH
ncbi:hypothetical protein DL89DRAFT_71914 [Linderina pennispora]|uniref:Uncharacterized protein n=1 Tax=Linderina pennispora TaxID=61395 RepID=A0A1Y1VYM3_9FUNG|nr:uncharacterized protein DL89DRAFT_71914 [Linderina pennispora]ORX66106.1 hypothetical protein DL89DRAFT_71914 [Linderina pennispora]